MVEGWWQDHPWAARPAVLGGGVWVGWVAPGGHELSILASFPGQLLPCASVVWLWAVEPWDREGEGQLLTFVSRKSSRLYIFNFYFIFLLSIIY